MILVIGEALIDLIESQPGTYDAVVGGANANVAVALAARQTPHLFLGRLSSDGFGRLIRNHLESKDVNVSECLVVPDQTSLAVVSVDKNGVASYSFYLKETADWGWTEEELPSMQKLEALAVDAIQFGCLTMAIEPGSSNIRKWLSQVANQNSITLSHDLNIRPALGFPRETEKLRVEALNLLSHIIKASDADVGWLYDLPDDSQIDSIAASWARDRDSASRRDVYRIFKI